MKTKKNQAIILMIMGAVLIAFSIYSYQNNNDFAAKSIETEGEIFYVNESVHTGDEMESEKNRVGRVEYDISLQISFYTEDSVKQTFSTKEVDDKGTYYEGQKVRVSYDPENPNKARMGTSINIKYPYMRIGGGVVMIIVGVVLMILKRRKK